MRLLYQVIISGFIDNVGNEHIDAFQFNPSVERCFSHDIPKQDDLLQSTRDAVAFVKTIIEQYTERDDCVAGRYVYEFLLYGVTHNETSTVLVQTDAKPFSPSDTMYHYVNQIKKFEPLKFYIFHDPYFAVISAPSTEVALEMHKENMTDFSTTVNEIPSEDAYVMFKKSANEDESVTKGQDDSEFMNAFKEPTMVLIDSDFI